MVMVMFSGYFSSMRYVVQVFQTASTGGKWPCPSISIGPELSKPSPQPWCPTQPPMRDVHMMANPIHQLAASGIVVPTPILVYHAADIRPHARGADPHVVI